MRRSGSVRVGALLCGLAVVWCGTAAAQATPLRKTDLVRLLTNPSMTKAQVAQRVRAACLAFEPTSRDRVDLQALGADATVMAEVNECLRKKAAAAPAPPPATRPAAQPPATRPATARPAPATTARATPAAPGPGAGMLILALQQRVFVPAGTEAAFQVQVTRAGRPVPNLALAVRGDSLRAVTNARGVATFRFPAGTATGIRALSVVAADNPAAAGAADVRLAVVAGPPTAVDLEPRRLEARAGAPVERRRVTLSLKDAYANPIGGERVEFRPLTAALGIAPVSGRTDSLGRLSVSFVNAAFKADGQIGVFVRGAQVGSLAVGVAPKVLSQSRTAFVSGQGQVGVVGRPLGQPLVLEVRDTTGALVAGETVVFEAVNGETTPNVATTDARGQVSVSVTAGRRAGTTVVRASAEDLRKEITLRVAPGPAATLVVMRDTTPVSRALALSSTQPVLLRVMARDSFGNEAPVTRLRTSVRDPNVVRVARSDTSGGAGRVELRARASGTTQIELDAAGLRRSLAAEVLLPLATGGGMVAVRVGYTGFDYGFHELALRGRPGPIAEVAFGWSVRGSLRVALGFTFASLKLDTAGLDAPVQLANGSLRFEYSVLSRGSVRPVVSVGAGQFQTRATGIGGLGRHTSLFWLAGAGLDFPLRERMTVELRAATHQLHQSKTQFAEAGRVGALTAVTLGFRFGS